MLITATTVFGLEIPSAGSVFATALIVHILAGLTCVVSGELAATAPKRPGRHPRAGTVYYWGVTVVFATATIMAALQWAEDWYLLLIGAVAFGSATVGYLARRRRWPRWSMFHIPGMGLSYVAMLTAFYVDNGPHLPLWNRLPIVAFWVGPSLIGIPLILRALAKYRPNPPAHRATGAPPVLEGER